MSDDVFPSIAFTDRDGHRWTVVEYKMENGKRKRVPFRHLPMGDPSAQGRAFIPADDVGVVLLYRFETFAHRNIEPRTLQQQLDAAHPVHATPRERMEPRRAPPASP